jgi:hypothetical protein
MEEETRPRRHLNRREERKEQPVESSDGKVGREDRGEEAEEAEEEGEDDGEGEGVGEGWERRGAQFVRP